jgi:hypothetical protein
MKEEMNMNAEENRKDERARDEREDTADADRGQGGTKGGDPVKADDNTPQPTPRIGDAGTKGTGSAG